MNPFKIIINSDVFNQYNELTRPLANLGQV
jgi:hypothetical protein